MNNLNDLRNELIQGQKLSMQGSDQRRAPEKKAVPYLLNARNGLKDYVQKNPQDGKAWLLLSQAEECLLNYSAALENLQKVIELGDKNRKNLKKLVLLKEYESKWKELALSPEQLEELGEYVEGKIETQGCDHTLIYTKEWLDKNMAKSKKAKIVKSLQNQGGFCDCEVLLNVID